jgi:hypothetical protein
MKALFYFFIRFVSIFLLFIYGAEHLGAQTAIKTNLPRILKKNTSQTFDLVIKGNGKGTVSSYELQGPKEVTFTAIPSVGASVRIFENTVRIDFSYTKDATIETSPVKLTLKVGAEGTYSLSHKIVYAETPDKDSEFAVSVIKVDDKSNAAMASSGYTTIREKNSAFNSGDFVYNDPEALRQQLMQTYSDSKQIRAVGESEKEKAREKLTDAQVTQALLEYLDDQRLKNKIHEQLLLEKDRAMADYKLAQHIILVGRSMEQDAMDSKEWIALMEKELSKEDNMLVNEFNSLGYESMASQYNKAGPGDAVVVNSLYYRIQLGAFKKRCPRKREFARIGTVDIVKENGWYKVLLGHFMSKDEAMIRQESVVAAGQEAFIAAYKDGKREL